MASPYAQGLELLARIQEQVADMKPRMTVQQWYAISQNWNALKMAVIATGEVADTAVMVSRRQNARYDYQADAVLQSSKHRKIQVDACIKHFRYVTALSDKARTLKTKHESVLHSLMNVQAYYEGALAPDAHVVHNHRRFLDSLERNLEKVKRKQRLQIIALRWVQMNATANLARQAEEFHFTCRKLEIQTTKVENARKLANDLRKERRERVREYERLESAMLGLEWDIEIGWWDERVLGAGDTAAGDTAAADAPVQDECSDEMDQSI